MVKKLKIFVNKFPSEMIIVVVCLLGETSRYVEQ